MERLEKERRWKDYEEMLKLELYLEVYDEDDEEQ